MTEEGADLRRPSTKTRTLSTVEDWTMVSALAHRAVVQGANGGYTVAAELFVDAQRGGHRC
ncbi:hypothetical protein ACFU5B_13170 [Streptomyces murinus]|uniref:hypothetical protein n=1 Tax=Streptomyces murinus TaxID=33900 RepID=UPI003626BF77